MWALPAVLGNICHPKNTVIVQYCKVSHGGKKKQRYNKSTVLKIKGEQISVGSKLRDEKKSYKSEYNS